VVTIADVAKRAGVSIATVSRVLSPPSARPHPVNRTTAERVTAAARELQFVPSAIAQGLITRRSNLIGLVVPDLTDPHYPQIATGVEQAARAAKRSVLIGNALGDPRHLPDSLERLRGRRVDAIVLSGGSALTQRELRAAVQVGLPLVLIGRPRYAVNVPYASIDNVSAARTATEHLTATRRRRIAHLAGPGSQSTMADRLRGYGAAMRAGHLRGMVIATDGTPEEAFEQVRARLSWSDRPEAIFAATDRLAIAALAAAHDVGLRVPRDLAIIGFDDIPL